MVEHEDIGLLDELGTGDPLGTQQHVDRDRGRGDRGHEKGLQVEVAGELLVEDRSAFHPSTSPAASASQWRASSELGSARRRSLAPWDRFQRAMTLV